MDRRILLIVALIYLFWPADLLPGVPIDDIIVIAVSLMAQKSRESLERIEVIPDRDDEIST